MKKNFVAIALIALFFSMAFTGCEKEDIHSKSKSVSELAPELQELYVNVPSFNFENIALVNSDIIKFENAEQYISTLNNLNMQYETWSDIFFEHYKLLSDEELDSVISALNFDPYWPIELFEQQLGILNNNLRFVNVLKEEKWMRLNSGETPELDDIVISPIEQALYSRHHEVCIGDTIYQMRENGITIIIPISEISHLNDIRNTSVSDLENLVHELKNIEIRKSISECHSSGYYKEGKQNHPEVGEKFFIWNYKFKTPEFLHRSQVTTTITNYKWVNNKIKWDYTTCSLNHNTDTYSFISNTDSCISTLGPYATSQTPIRLHHRVMINYSRKYQSIPDGTYGSFGPFSFQGNTYIETMTMEPQNSSASYRHQGWTYNYNLLSGNLM